MKRPTAFALLVALASCAAAANDAPMASLPTAPPLDSEGRCVVGSVWKQDCNTCRCELGGLQACTRRLCLREDAGAGRRARAARSLGAEDSPDRDMCTPGRVWKQDCNTCSCSEAGQALCTIMACPEGQSDVTQAPSPAPAPASCTPGTSWMEDCNRCRCGESGIPMCTLKACISKKQKRRARLEDSPEDELECVPGSFHRHGCHSCSCSAAGALRCEAVPPCVEEPRLRPGPERRLARCLRRCKEHRDDDSDCRAKCGIKVRAPGRTTTETTEPSSVTAASAAPNEVPVHTNGTAATGCAPAGRTWSDGCMACRCTPRGRTLCAWRRGCRSTRPHAPLPRTPSTSSTTTTPLPVDPAVVPAQAPRD